MREKKIQFTQALEERYLAYALSTITHRALPDVRDGLKPVHRRLLYAMSQLRLGSGTGFKKSARIVGDVIGKYHPHGDQSVYDALVRLAQEFSTRYLLINGQGNFGNIDGDNAAAMRYTEAKLTSISELMLQDISEETVDFIKTYDGTESEPMVLPCAFPNLLANGSSGIAVGMATNIPPHNIGEISKALIKLLKNPNTTVSQLMTIIPGPDFPTGGEIIDSNSLIKEAYSKGKGSLRLRAKWHEESLGRGQYQIVITEIPYQVNKSRIIEKISELIDNKKINYLETIQDESAEDIRIVLLPKTRNIKANVIIEDICKVSDLETRFSINMNAINAKFEPKLFNLKEILNSFIGHRFEILKRRTNYRLAQTENRIEILKGFLIVYKNLEKIIKIIRTDNDPEKKLITTFKFTKRQVEAVLAMRLRQLKKLEEKDIKLEYQELVDYRKELNLILKSKIKQSSILNEEFNNILDKYNKSSYEGKRRTIINNDYKTVEYSIDEFDSKEPVSIICSHNGWIKSIKGHQDDYNNVKYKDGDKSKFIIQCKNNDKLLLFSSLGKFYTLNCSKITTGRGFGEPVSVVVDKSDNEEVVELFVFNENENYLIASTSGKGFIVNTSDLIASTRSGKKIMNLKQGDKSISCNSASGNFIGVISGDKKSLKFLTYKLSEIPQMQKGRGITLQKFKVGKTCYAFTYEKNKGITFNSSNRKPIPFNDLKPWLGKRAQAGKIQPKNLLNRLLDK
ncbi:MAG: DNA topoisomerase IV subunit A [Candidatus Pelagibacterales bacterium]|jgi:topoisomerase-4 subunit A|tara:strand:+ start:3564 stop:5777 length:2214 start_codon:yes stop_codon:yes gene_type:complete